MQHARSPCVACVEQVELSVCMVKVAVGIEAAGDGLGASASWAFKLRRKRLGETLESRLGQLHGDHLKPRVAVFRWGLERSHVHDRRCWYQCGGESHAESRLLRLIEGTVTPAKLEEWGARKISYFRESVSGNKSRGGHNNRRVPAVAGDMDEVSAWAYILRGQGGLAGGKPGDREYKHQTPQGGR